LTRKPVRAASLLFHVARSSLQLLVPGSWLLVQWLAVRLAVRRCTPSRSQELRRRRATRFAFPASRPSSLAYRKNNEHIALRGRSPTLACVICYRVRRQPREVPPNECGRSSHKPDIQPKGAPFERTKGEPRNVGCSARRASFLCAAHGRRSGRV